MVRGGGYNTLLKGKRQLEIIEGFKIKLYIF